MYQRIRAFTFMAMIAAALIPAQQVAAVERGELAVIHVPSITLFHEGFAVGEVIENGANEVDIEIKAVVLSEHNEHELGTMILEAIDGVIEPFSRTHKRLADDQTGWLAPKIEAAEEGVLVSVPGEYVSAYTGKPECAYRVHYMTAVRTHWMFGGTLFDEWVQQEIKMEAIENGLGFLEECGFVHWAGDDPAPEVVAFNELRHATHDYIVEEIGRADMVRAGRTHGGWYREAIALVEKYGYAEYARDLLHAHPDPIPHGREILDAGLYDVGSGNPAPVPILVWYALQAPELMLEFHAHYQGTDHPRTQDVVEAFVDFYTDDGRRMPDGYTRAELIELATELYTN